MQNLDKSQYLSSAIIDYNHFDGSLAFYVKFKKYLKKSCDCEVLKSSVASVPYLAALAAARYWPLVRPPVGSPAPPPPRTPPAPPGTPLGVIEQIQLLVCIC